MKPTREISYADLQAIFSHQGRTPGPLHAPYNIAPEVEENFYRSLSRAIDFGEPAGSCQGLNGETMNALWEVAGQSTTTSIENAHIAWYRWASGEYGREAWEAARRSLLAAGMQLDNVVSQPF